MLSSAPPKYLNKRLLSQWDTTGKKKGLELFQKLYVEAKTSAPGTQVSVAFKALMTEIVLHAIKGNVKAMCSFLSEAEITKREAAQSALVDVLWIMCFDAPEGEDEKEKFIKGLDEMAKAILEEKLVPRWVLQERLSGEFLERIGFGPAKTLKKKEIRHKTRCQYVQTKFNLLREESEGYSKLINEVFLLMSLPANIRPSKECFVQKTRSLIGYFDLNPNRVMDIMLEGLESQMSGKRSSEIDIELCKTVSDILDYFKPKATHAIMGFKFQFYQKNGIHKYFHENSDRTIVTPSSLFHVTAILIATGNIKLEELWSYLVPSDIILGRARSKFVKAKHEMASKVNSVNMNVSEAQRKPDNRGTQQSFGKNNQKLELLYHLLSIGAWEHALKIFKRLDAIALASDERISKKITEIVSRIIEPLYATFCSKFRLFADDPAAARPETKDEKIAKEDRDTKEEGEEDEEGMEIEDSSDSKHLSGRTFAWELKPATDILELPKTIQPLLRHLGLYIHREPVLFVKLCRVLQEHIQARKKSEKNRKKYDSWLSEDLEIIIDDCLIPGFSVLPANMNLTDSLWKLLGALPYWDRYRIYGYWKQHAYYKSPEMAMQKALSTLQVRQYKKRVSASNVKDCAKLLQKSAYPNPLIATDQILKQVEAYENLSKPILESLKNFHKLTHDTLVYTIILYLTQEKKRLGEGLNIEHWFRNITTFCGNFFRKYPEVEFTAIIDLVVNRLKDELNLETNCLEVVVLEKLLSHMAGIDAIEDLGETQLEGLAGGSKLQDQTAMFRQHKTKRKMTSYIVHHILESKAVIPLFILISQCKQYILYKMPTKYVELISELYDITQGVMIQLGEFVQTYKKADYVKSVPSLYDLVKTYNLEPSDAFFIIRPILAERQEKLPDEIMALNAKTDAKANEKAKTNGSTKAKPDVVEMDIEISEKKENEKVTSKDTEKEPQKKIISLTGKSKDSERLKKEQAAKKKLLEAMREKPFIAASGSALVASVDATLPKTILKSLTPELYASFWALTIADLRVPAKLYREQINKLKDDKDIDAKLDESKRKKEKEKRLKIAKELQNEMEKQKKRHRRVMTHIKNNSRKWFKEGKDTVNLFWQECILKRVFLTPIDAIYCFVFTKIVWELNTPNLSLITVFQRMMHSTLGILACHSSNEASRYGIFVKEMWTHLTKWKDNKKLYNEDRAKLTHVFSLSKQKKITYEEFCKLYKRWGKRLNNHIYHGMKSSNKANVKNALYFFKRICPVFPRVKQHGKMILIRLKEINEAKENKNSAIAVLALRLHTQTEARRKSWIDEEWPFDTNEEQKAKSSGSTKPVTKLSKTTKNAPTKRRLNASAKEFEPKPRVTPKPRSSPTSDTKSTKDPPRKKIIKLGGDRGRKTKGSSDDREEDDRRKRRKIDLATKRSKSPAPRVEKGRVRNREDPSERRVFANNDRDRKRGRDTRDMRSDRRDGRSDRDRGARSSRRMTR